jgi:hypothetical protein
MGIKKLGGAPHASQNLTHPISQKPSELIFPVRRGMFISENEGRQINFQEKILSAGGGK